VLAHVTPSFDANHNIIAFHSTRRVPNSKVGMQKYFEHLVGIIESNGIEYDEFVSSLCYAAERKIDMSWFKNQRQTRQKNRTKQIFSPHFRRRHG